MNDDKLINRLLLFLAIMLFLAAWYKLERYEECRKLFSWKYCIGE